MVVVRMGALRSYHREWCLGVASQIIQPQPLEACASGKA